MLHDRKSNLSLSLSLAAFAITALLLSPAAWSGGSGRCISASVPEALILPDGSLHEAGLLRICLDREFSPVAGLHRAYVDGRAVGRFLSRAGQSEAAADDEKPFVVLRRDRRGALVLEGYADPVGGRLNTYLIQSPGHASYDVVSHWRTARSVAAEGDRQDHEVILLAAARH
jgi:hypothetical protein